MRLLWLLCCEVTNLAEDANTPGLKRGIMSNSSQAEIAKKTWELSNNVMEIQPGEEIYRYDKNQQQSIQAAKPWEKDPHFFKASFGPTIKKLSNIQ